jgi:hypothetical protein
MKPSFSIRAVFSLVLVGIGAIIALDQPEAPFVVTETPVVVPTAPAPSPLPKPAPSPIGEPAEVVCTFRCANCRRAPSVAYRNGETPHVYLNCNQCTRAMPRTDPKLTPAEQAIWDAYRDGLNRATAHPQASYQAAPQVALCRT